MQSLSGRCSLALASLVAVQTGCLSGFSERSFHMDPSDSVQVSARSVDMGSECTRTWLRKTQQELAHLLPGGDPEPLTTETMTTGDGRPVDVFSHFGVDGRKLQSIFSNSRGIRFSAQASSSGYYIDTQAPSWPGFEDVWIPIRLARDGELALSGRLGLAREENGDIREADCLVILPGMFGDHGVKRSRDLAIPLRESGFHVLHLELRGHGQTEARYPTMYHNFGALETDDLMQVSDWLEAHPHVRRTGLIGYCWTANMALLATWYDNVQPDDPQISPAMRPHLVGHDLQRQRFSAGVIAFSPAIRWEVLMDELDRDRSRLGLPIFAAIQDTVRDRMRLKNWPEVSGNLRQLIEYEYQAYDWDLPRGSLEAYDFLRLMPYKDQPAGDKMELARVPVLIVHGADDPLVPAQDIADFAATIQNPGVAALILPSGGHVGVSAYAPNYNLSLITNFFDPALGAAAAPPPQVTTLSAADGPVPSGTR